MLDLTNLSPEVAAELAALTDLFDGDIDKPETAAAIRGLAKVVEGFMAAAFAAKNPVFGPFLSALASAAINDAVEKFIASKTVKA